MKMHEASHAEHPFPQLIDGRELKIPILHDLELVEYEFQLDDWVLFLIQRVR